MQDNKPTTHQGDLTKLPRALAPLIERPQWAVWRWTQQPMAAGRSRRIRRSIRSAMPAPRIPAPGATTPPLWRRCRPGRPTASAYVLTEADPFAAIDLDHCRHPDTHSIDVWAQNFLDVARHTYAEVTPSGDGCRIWGLTGNGTDPVNRKFTLEIDGKQIAAELFRRTPKALTVTGYRLDTIRELTNLDRRLAGPLRGENAAKLLRQKRLQHRSTVTASMVAGPATTSTTSNGSCAKVRGGANRSDTFHMVVGHYLGCGWSVERIYEHLRQFPDGIAGRYLGEGRLSREIARSASKYADRALPLFDVNGGKAPEKIVEAPETPSGRRILLSREPISPEPRDDRRRIQMKPTS